MNSDLKRLVSEAAVMERLVSRLYWLLSLRYKDDESFWWQLSLEEQNHSSIFESFLKNHLPSDLFPEEIIDHDIETVVRWNSHLADIVDNFEKRPRNKKADYLLALEVESTSSEDIFQEAIVRRNIDRNIQIIQKLAGDNIRHKKRIQELIRRLPKK